MIVERFVTGRARSNAYLVAPDGGGDAFLVDAGVGAPGRIARRVAELGVRPRALLLTHGHPDHVWTARRLAARFDVPVFLHESDWRWLDRPLTGGFVPVPFDVLVSKAMRLRPPSLERLAAGADLQVAGVGLRVIHTPGHTRGSCSFVAGHLCFSGDTLFAGGRGHSGYPGGSARDLGQSVDRLLDLPDDVVLHPGHGPERPLAEVRERVRRAAAS